MTTPSGLLKEASALSTASRTNEDRRRTVIGRAYYASYHAVLQAAEALGYSYTRGQPPFGRHEQLIGWATTQNLDPDLREAAAMLSELKTLRRVADYLLDTVIEHNHMADCLEKATYVVGELLADEA